MQGYTVAENAGVSDAWQRERRAYERLCRGEGKLPHNMSSKLLCYYQVKHSLFCSVVCINLIF